MKNLNQTETAILEEVGKHVSEEIENTSEQIDETHQEEVVEETVEDVLEDAENVSEETEETVETDEIEESKSIEESTPSLSKKDMMKEIFNLMAETNKSKLTDVYENIKNVLTDVEVVTDTVSEKSLNLNTEVKVDVQEDIDALTNDEELSEEFKQKAATIFEAAVQNKVNIIIEEKVQEFEQKFEEELSSSVEDIRDDIVEKVDSYLSYVVDEWVKDNELAVENGIRTEITENFIDGLRGLFNENYIAIPEEKEDLVDGLLDKIESLEEKLNEQINNNVKLSSTIREIKQQSVFENVTRDMTDMQIEKFEKLVENVSSSNIDDYKTKISIIKESYFKQENEAQVLKEDVVEVQSEEDTISDDAQPLNEGIMSLYTKAISRTVKK